MNNPKYNIGDIVKTKYCDNLERIENKYYDNGMNEYRYNLVDLYGETDSATLESSIIKPEKVKRIDMIMLQENPSKILSELINSPTCNHCAYDKLSSCDGMYCEKGAEMFFEEEIDNDINNIMENQINNRNSIEVENTEELNDFMKEYKKIVTDLSELCIKKNKDYGSSVVDTYDKFGDISYLTRITDKYNRILSLYQNKGKHEVKDESIIDTALDMANYCLLWVANKQLVDKEDNNDNN